MLSRFMNVIYASCYPAPATNTTDPLAGGLEKADDTAGAGKLFSVLIVIIVIILYNAYIHSVHSATSFKNPPTTTTLGSRLFNVLNLLPRQSLPLPCQVGYFMC